MTLSRRVGLCQPADTISSALPEAQRLELRLVDVVVVASAKVSWGMGEAIALSDRRCNGRPEAGASRPATPRVELEDQNDLREPVVPDLADQRALPVGMIARDPDEHECVEDDGILPARYSDVGIFG